MIALLGEIVDGRFRIGIGDPTFVGWFTVLCYFVSAALCMIEARRCRLDSLGDRRESIFWLGFVVVLLLLGINKQLDLQSWVTQVGRDLAKAQGWYDQRRVVQKWFIVAVAVGGMAGITALAWFCRKSLRHNSLALIGISFLVCFVVIRAASFHHVDELLRLRGWSVTMNNILELGGIGCIALAAIVRLLGRGHDHSGSAKLVDSST